MVEIPFLVLQVAALIVVGIGAACDLKSHKIPNKLTFPASGIGIILQAIYFASWSTEHDFYLQLAAGATTAMLGWIFAVFIMSFTKLFMRKFGHGDTKLMAAVGTFVGPWLVLLVYFYYGLCFGVYTMVKLAAAVPWRQLLLYEKSGLNPLTVGLDNLNQKRKELIPVAPFIALGTLCCVLFEKPTLELFGFK